MRRSFSPYWNMLVSGAMPSALDLLARVQRGVDVHHQPFGRADVEAVRAGDARRIEQRIDGQQRRVGAPACRARTSVKRGNSSSPPAVDGQPARRQAVLPLAAHRAKVARALECRDVVLPVGVEVDAESRRSRDPWAVRDGLQAALAVVEHLGVVGELLRHAVDHLVHAHRRVGVHAEVEELRRESAFCHRPTARDRRGRRWPGGGPNRAPSLRRAACRRVSGTGRQPARARGP